MGRRSSDGFFPERCQSATTFSASWPDRICFELLDPWEIRNSLDICLKGASLPQIYLVHASQITRTQIYIATGSIISLFLVIGCRLTNRISKPLENLAKSSGEVASGNYLVALDKQTSAQPPPTNATSLWVLISIATLILVQNKRTGWSLTILHLPSPSLRLTWADPWVMIPGTKPF